MCIHNMIQMHIQYIDSRDIFSYISQRINKE